MTDAPDDRPKHELRARDLVARQGDPTLADELDPATVAQLARWFGLGAAEVGVAPEVAEAPPPPHDADEAQRLAALAAMDLTIATQMERWRQPPPLRARELDLSRRDPSAIDDELLARAGSIADPRSYEISDAFRQQLRECTPQALLRDLARPEFHFERRFTQLFGEDAAPDPRAAARAAIATRYRAAVVPRPSQHFAARAAIVRPELEAPWAELPQRAPMATRGEHLS